MKKLYTALAAVIIAFSAQASTPIENGWHSIGTGHWFEGLLTIFDAFDEYNDGLNWEVEVEESDEAAGYYRIQPYGAGSPVAEIIGVPIDTYFYLDARDPQKVVLEGEIGGFITIQYSGFDGDGTYFEEKQIFQQRSDYFGSLENNVVYYPFGSFEWFADVEGAGWVPCNLEGDVKIVLPGGEVRPNWVSVGTGSFTDGFLSPFYRYFDSQAAQTYTTDVEVFERDHVPGYFKIADAFMPFKSYAEMVIDARRKDFVRLDMTDLGIWHDVRGSIYAYSRFIDEISPVKEMKTYEDYMANQPQYVATFTEDDATETGTITFPADAIVLSFPIYYEAQGNPLQRWTNDDLALPTVITIPGRANGINDIKVDGSAAAIDGPVEYYNLQGVRVENPASGLYIKRQGNKATKVFIK